MYVCMCNEIMTFKLVNNATCNEIMTFKLICDLMLSFCHGPQARTEFMRQKYVLQT